MIAAPRLRAVVVPVAQWHRHTTPQYSPMAGAFGHTKKQCATHARPRFGAHHHFVMQHFSAAHPAPKRRVALSPPPSSTMYHDTADRCGLRDRREPSRPSQKSCYIDPALFTSASDIFTDTTFNARVRPPSTTALRPLHLCSRFPKLPIQCICPCPHPTCPKRWAIIGSARHAGPSCIHSVRGPRHEHFADMWGPSLEGGSNLPRDARAPFEDLVARIRAIAGATPSDIVVSLARNYVKASRKE